MSIRRTVLAAALFLTYTFSLSEGTAAAPQFEIKLGKPEFVLPQFTGPYQEREASIALEEYETAERLRELLDAGKRQQVLAELEKFYSIELSPAMLMLQAQIYFSLEMYDKAEATYLEVLKRMPQLIRAHSDLGQLYLVREQPQKARHHFARAVALGSNEALVHGQLAYLNLTQYGPYSAISSYQQAAALEPDNFQWQQGLLAALIQARMYDAAEALLDEITARKPNMPELWLNKATLALHKEDYPRALTSLEMALLLGNEDQRNLQTSAKLHLQLGSYDRAMALLEKSFGRNDFDIASVTEYFTWLSHLELWDDLKKLLDIAGKHLDKLKPAQQSRYYLHMAQLEVQRKRFTQADQMFNRSLNLDPTNGECLLAYAEFLTKQKDYIRAELLYMRADALSSVEKQAQLGRAQLYIEMQNYKSALELLRQIHQKYPDSAGVKDNIEIIENIIALDKSNDTKLR